MSNLLALVLNFHFRFALSDVLLFLFLAAWVFFVVRIPDGSEGRNDG